MFLLTPLQETCFLNHCGSGTGGFHGAVPSSIFLPCWFPLLVIYYFAFTNQFHLLSCFSFAWLSWLFPLFCLAFLCSSVSWKSCLFSTWHNATTFVLCPFSKRFLTVLKTCSLKPVYSLMIFFKHTQFMTDFHFIFPLPCCLGLLSALYHYWLSLSSTRLCRFGDYFSFCLMWYEFLQM